MKKFAKVIGAIAILSGSIAPASVQAFGLPAIDQSNIAPGGVNLGCNFAAFNDPDNSFGFNQSADVTLFVPGSPGFESAGGNGWDSGSINTTSYRAITVQDIETQCSQLQTGTVAIVSQNGADAASYAAEDFIGITFTATPVGDTQSYSYTIALQGASSTAVVATRVVNNVPNQAPTANAGTNQSVQSGVQVTLDGSSSSDSDGSITNYAWTRTGGTGDGNEVTLDLTDPARPTFTDSSLTSNVGAVTHIFSLEVTDNDAATSATADTVTITITPPPNAAPTATASAASTTVTSGDQVELLGGGTDDDGTIASYAWSRTGGTGGAVTLSSATAQNPTFTDNSLNPGDSPVTHEFSLVVTDDDAAASAPATVTITIDPPVETTPPTALSLVRTTPTTQTTNADSLSWTLTFDEPVQNVDAADFTATGTTAAVGVTGSGALYTVTLSGGDLASVSGSVSIAFATMPTISDLAGNAFVRADPATNEASYTLDNQQDAVAISGPAGPVNSEFTVTLTFQQNGPAAAPNAGQTDLNTVLSALQITNATRTGGSSFTGSTVTFNLTPADAGAVTVSLPAGVASDAAGNPTLVSNTFSVTASDTQPPVITVPMNIAVNTDAGQPSAVVNYGAVTATDNVELATGPTRTSGPASGAAFPLGETTVAFEAVDTAGNIGTASFTVTVSDAEDPVVSVPENIRVVADAGQSSSIVTYAAPTATDNVAVTFGPTLTAGLASGSAFPLGETTVTFQAQDAATNTGSASFTVTVTDGQSPVVTVPEDITVSTDAGVSTAVVSYAAPTATDNVAVTSGPILTAGLASGATFPLGETTVTYEATDGDGNTGIASFTVTVEDTEAPTIVSVSANVTEEAGPAGTRSIAFSATVNDNVDTVQPVYTLNGTEISSPFDFTVGENVIIVSAIDSAGNQATPEQITVTITQGQAPEVPLITTATINANRSMTIGGTAEIDSTVRVTFPDSSFQDVTATGGAYSVISTANMPGGSVTVVSTDALGNVSAPATTDLFPDYDGPTVTITGAPARLLDETPFTITVTFSEAVTGFTQSDIAVTGANITAFAGASPTYTAEITPVVATPITISIAEGAAEDAFANPSAASGVISITNAALTATEEMIVTMAQTRTRSTMSAQPKISQFLLGGQTGSFNANATRGVGNFDFTTSSEYPVWVAGQGRWATEGDIESSYANVAIGGHIGFGENFLLGAMTQFDTFTADEDTSQFEGTGWLAGPYAVLRMADQPLVFSASYLIGQSDNAISPLGTYEDNFTSDRSILTFGVAGEVELTRITLIPLLDIIRATEESEAYTDGVGANVRAQEVTMTEATLGFDFIMPLELANGKFELLGGFGATSASTDNGIEETDTTRGRTALGFRYIMESGGRISGRATYDGAGQDDYEAIGAELAYEISF